MQGRSATATNFAFPPDLVVERFPEIPDSKIDPGLGPGPAYKTKSFRPMVRNFLEFFVKIRLFFT